ncbi:MAG: redoxin domain-containing protein [Steroidobacteraceae bacterium]
MPYLVSLLSVLLAVSPCGSVAVAGARNAPEFTHTAPAEWINSKPLTLAELRGRVVLVEFWTFDCINCRRTLPWLTAMHEHYRDVGLVVVSVHTPEFERERIPANVRAAIAKLNIEYPVMLDNDFSYWKALGNRFWPAFYLIGRTGRIEATEIGELHLRDPRGRRFEADIARLLAAQ